MSDTHSCDATNHFKKRSALCHRKAKYTVQKFLQLAQDFHNTRYPHRMNAIRIILFEVTAPPAEQEVLQTTETIRKQFYLGRSSQIRSAYVVRSQRVSRNCFTAVVNVHPWVLFKHIQDVSRQIIFQLMNLCGLNVV